MPIFQPQVLRAARKRSFKTQEQMARAMGVTLRGYQRWERGESEPSAERALALGEFFDVDPLHFYADEVAA